MLNLLRDYSDRQGLCPEPGFKSKYVRWALDFNSDGKFLNLRDLRSDENQKGREIVKCPHLQFTADREKRQFLVDSIKFIAMIDENEDLSQDEAIRVKHLYFVRLLRHASCALPELGLIADFLERREGLKEIRTRFAQVNFSGKDIATFTVIGRSPVYLVEDPKCLDWWRDCFPTLNEKKGNSARTISKQHNCVMRCFCSGRVVEPAKTHPKISGLGGQQAGDALSSFNKASFCSYFLQQSENAALSNEMAASYTSALNHLIAKHSQQLAGASVIHWYAGETKVEKQEDPMGLLDDDDSFNLSWLDQYANEKNEEMDALHLAKVFLRTLKSGENPRLSELANHRYYAMVLSANAGRVIAREWIEGQFGELAESIVNWFEALEIINIFRDNSAKSPKIERVITSLLPAMKPGQKYADWIKPIGGERSQLWHAAISRKVSIPYKVVSRIVSLHQSFMLSGDFEESKHSSLLHTRMGLLKAYHIRKGDKNMLCYLNENHPHPAYHCGRLMAVYADLQHAALGDVGAGVVQRYYAAASATPALILGRLSRSSQFHLNKLEGGLAYWFEQRLTEIWCKLKDTTPKTLTLEEQSLFALGYYQQIADRKKSDNNPTNENHENKGE